VLFGHKATSVDLNSKTLVCEGENGQKVTFNPKCLIIADGYRSRVRDILAESDKNLKVQKWPWTLSFRVLCSDYNPKTDLNPYIHYIQNQIYTSRFLDGRWTTVIAMKEDSPEFLKSDNPSDENVANLKAHLKKLDPKTLSLFTEENYKQYFTRTIFSGAVTKVSKLVIDKWAVLLGDAAHSAFPATGEGINSALEDCSVLNQSLQSGSDLGECLETFEKNRLEDANALSDIAYGAVMQNFKSGFQMIFLSLFKKFVGPSKEDYLFGTISKNTKRYSEIVNIWKQQTALIGGPNIPPN